MQDTHQVPNSTYNHNYRAYIIISLLYVVNFLFKMQYAVWDLAFHMIPFARIDPEFAKNQLELFLSERYMAPNGQIPGKFSK